MKKARAIDTLSKAKVLELIQGRLRVNDPQQPGLSPQTKMILGHIKYELMWIIERLDYCELDEGVK